MSVTISFIGSGKMSAHLIPAFLYSGVKINGIYSRNKTTANHIANQYQISVVENISDLQSDVIFICTNDDAIGYVADSFKTKAIVVHCSGSVSSQMLAQHKSYGVFYPIQSMAGIKDYNFREVPVAIVASSSEVSKLLLDLAGKISDEGFICDDLKRQKIHLAAVMTNNFINHLVNKTKTYLDKENLDYKYIVPLLKYTMSKLTEEPFNFIQTGPAMRKDMKVISLHEQLLADEPSLLEIYKTITKSIIEHEDH